MADVKIIQATRWADGQSRNCVYIATVQGDNWIYFNDDKFWRTRPDGSIVQLLYLNKEVWVNTDILTINSISDFNATTAQNIIHGGGGTATNAQVEQAVKWAIKKASEGYITYSQANRNLKNPNGDSYDCSSFIITAFYTAGIDVNATYTGDMKQAFLDLGFTWIPGSYFPSSECLRGDILLNEALHTQMYIGNNQDVNCGSTPAAVCEHTPNNYGSGWDGILRLE